MACHMRAQNKRARTYPYPQSLGGVCVGSAPCIGGGRHEAIGIPRIEEVGAKVAGGQPDGAGFSHQAHRDAGKGWHAADVNAGKESRKSCYSRKSPTEKRACVLQVVAGQSVAGIL